MPCLRDKVGQDSRWNYARNRGEFGFVAPPGPQLSAQRLEAADTWGKGLDNGPALKPKSSAASFAEDPAGLSAAGSLRASGDPAMVQTYLLFGLASADVI